MALPLKGLKIAILIAKGFEQIEMTEPQSALEEAGAQTFIISPELKNVQAWNHTDWGNVFRVDVPLEDADASNFDALLLPGGVMNPDALRINPLAVKFVQDFFNQGKPVAVICHGPWTLINAGVVKGRTLTSWPSLQLDLENAGATWINKEVVKDGNIVSSRKPKDIPAFNKAMIHLFADYKSKESHEKSA